MEKFYKLLGLKRSIRLLLNYLICKHSANLNKIPFLYNRSTVKYQKKGQNLKKINFLPNEADWIRIKLLAAAKGISVSYLFVCLMELETMGGEGDSAGVHVQPSQITLIHQISTPITPIITKKIRLRI